MWNFADDRCLKRTIEQSTGLIFHMGLTMTGPMGLKSVTSFSLFHTPMHKCTLLILMSASLTKHISQMLSARV